MDPITIALGLAQFAPTLLRYFGVGEKNVTIAENVVKTAQAVTGAASGPEALEMMKNNTQMQLDFQRAAMDIDKDLEQLYLLDRQDARARDTAFINSKRHNIRGDVLAYLAIGGLLGIILMLFMKSADMPPAVKDLLLVLAGALTAIVKDVYSFEFGTTRSSKEKDNVISTMAGKQ